MERIPRNCSVQEIRGCRLQFGVFNLAYLTIKCLPTPTTVLLTCTSAPFGISLIGGKNIRYGRKRYRQLFCISEVWELDRSYHDDAWVLVECGVRSLLKHTRCVRDRVQAADIQNEAIVNCQSGLLQHYQLALESGDFKHQQLYCWSRLSIEYCLFGNSEMNCRVHRVASSKVAGW